MNNSDRDRKSRMDATMNELGKALGQPSSGKRLSSRCVCLVTVLLAAAVIAVTGLTLYTILNWLSGHG